MQLHPVKSVVDTSSSSLHVSRKSPSTEEQVTKMLYLLLHVRGVNAVDGYMPSVGLLPVGRGSIRQEVKTPEPNRDEV